MSATDEANERREIRIAACRDNLFAGDLSGALGLIAWMLSEYEGEHKPKIKVASSVAKISRELREHPFAQTLGAAVKLMLEK